VKFALTGYGSRGDVEPFAALARELLRRGHEVRLAVPPWMLDFVQSAGLNAVPYGSNPLQLNDVNDVVRRINQIQAEWSAGLKTLADGADLLVTGKGEQAMSANVAEYYQIPNAALHFFPGDHGTAGGIMGQLANQAEAAQRRDLNLPDAPAPAPQPLEIQAYDELCFPGLADEWLAQGRRRPFVGALTLGLTTHDDAEVLSWIAAGEPPVYFGFGGGTQLPAPAETVGMISAACGELGQRALIGSGPNDLSRIPHPGHVKVVRGMSHAAIFPACRVVVHHGGAGTVATGMRAGVPALILWVAADDQPIWAEAITRLGIGSGREFRSTTTESLVADLRPLLSAQCAARARELATRMTMPAESAAKAADLLEDAVRTGRS
jgi:UDP:flavonoid glycosyltransferase YjiC (YdhE family)